MLCVNTSAFIITSILQLEVDVNTVAMALLKAVKLKLKPQVHCAQLAIGLMLDVVLVMFTALVQGVAGVLV